MSDEDSDIDDLGEEFGAISLHDVSKDLDQLIEQDTAGINNPDTRRKTQEATANYGERPKTTDDALRISMDRHRGFFNQPILSRKEVEVPDLVIVLIKIRDTEKYDKSIRREFILQLLKTPFLQISGPVFATLLTFTKLHESSEVVHQCLDLLIDLLEEISARSSGFVDTFQTVMTLSGLMRLLPDKIMTADLKTRLDTLNFSMQDTETIEKHLHNPDMTWSPDSAFIHEPVIPPVKDLLSSELDPKYVNLIKGPYQSKYHYIETWYRLMREDVLSPLRKAILEYKTLFTPEDSDTSQGHTLDHGYHHHLKSILTAERVRSETIYLVNFSLKGLANVDWNETDRLKPGTLLVLSNDHFESAEYALVSDNPEKPASEGKVWMKTVEGTKPYIDNRTHAIEPKVFFEPYRCVLERFRHLAAQTKRGVQFPFERYIVQCNTKVNSPSYLPRGTLMTVTKGFTIEDRIGDTVTQVKRTQEIQQETGKINDCGVEMDESQRVALNHALTHEVAIIQGPPGCGKSFIGSQLVKILMLNKSKWQTYETGYILMLSFTNHAIDQFIADCERSGTDMSRAARIGSRGNQSTEKYLLKNKRTTLRGDYEIRSKLRMIRSLNSKVTDLNNSMKANENIIESTWGRMDPPTPAMGEYTISRILHEYGTLYDDKNEGEVESLEYSVNIKLALESWCNDQSGDEETEFRSLNFEDILAIPEDKIGEYENKLFQLSMEERKSLYAGWCEKMKRLSEEKLKKLKEGENELRDQIYSAQKELDIATIKRCNIVAMTTTGASKHAHLLEAMKPIIVLVEEAAEVLESHIVAPLTTGCKHLIMIGDHQQLRPSISECELEKRNLSISLFERLILNDIPYSRLNCQHRMHPEISSLLVPHIYPELQNHPVVHTYPAIDGLAKRMSFLEHSHHEAQTGEKTTTRNNPFEAQYLVTLCRYLLLQGYSQKDISIICTYAGQVALINQYIAAQCRDQADPLYSLEEKIKMLNDEFADFLAFNKYDDEYITDRMSRWLKKRKEQYENKQRLLNLPRSKISDVLVTTVDNYQGEENKIILLSFVRSNKSGNIGFLKWENRICVALSRAKYGFYAVGNFKLFAKNTKSDLWRKLCLQMKMQEDGCLSDRVKIKCQKHGTIREVVDGPSLKRLSPHGGCDLVCGQELKCGHTCQKVCHLQDQIHDLSSCTVVCTGELDCGHSCRKICRQRGDDESFFARSSRSKNFSFRECQTCNKKVYCMEEIDEGTCTQCGNISRQVCSALKECKTMITVNLSCQHPAKIECHQRGNISEVKCMANIKAKLECGHEKSIKCHDKGSIKCEADVEFQPQCGHRVIEKCYNVTNIEWVNKYQCEELVRQITSRKCGHVLNLVCYQIQKGDPYLSCTELVKETLQCGHFLQRKCSEKPYCKRYDPVNGSCGHLKAAVCDERSQRSKSPCRRCKKL